MKSKKLLKLVVLPMLLIMLVGMAGACSSVGQYGDIENKSVEFTEFMLDNLDKAEDEELVGVGFMSPDATKSQITAAKRAIKKLSEAYNEYKELLGEDVECQAVLYGVYDRADTAFVKDVLLEVVFSSEKESETYQFVRLAAEEKDGNVYISEFKLSADYIFTTPSKKINKFLDIFVNRDGYLDVLKGLENTVIIAVTGLIIGIVIGTLIATVRVIPKYKMAACQYITDDNDPEANSIGIKIHKRNIFKALALSILTCGIYTWYWKYLLVKNIRELKRDKSSVVAEVLCVCLIPYYSIYWWYTRGNTARNELLKYNDNVIGDEIVYLVLDICGLGIVNMVLMQNDFNSVPTVAYLLQRGSDGIVQKPLNGICSLYVSFFRGTPIAVQLLLFYYVLFPLFRIPMSPVDVSVLVFGLNSGAYISEIMRSGIQSVDSGQMEAGRAVGLSFPVTMIKIVIPQAIKNILPTLGNEFIALIKETSVVSFVGATNLYTAFNMIGSNSYEFMVPFLAMAVVYIVVIMLITLGIKLMERGLKKSDRRN